MMPAPIEALKQVDVLIEGKVVAAYLNGEQVSTELLKKRLLESDTQINILLKIIPTTYYLGAEEAIFEVHTSYDDSNSCNNGYFFDPTGDLWGLSKHEGKWLASNIGNHFAHIAHGALKNIAEYLAVLQTHIPNNDLERDFIEQEQVLLIDLASQKHNITDYSFMRVSRQLRKLPTKLLEARLAFVEDLRLPDQIVATQSALMQKQVAN